MAWVQPAWLTAVISWLPISAAAQCVFAFCHGLDVGGAPAGELGREQFGQAERYRVQGP